jgi:formate hydrogenlyase subunit 6/NADH:ubiquinone oxidoreductase subunit I
MVLLLGTVSSLFAAQPKARFPKPDFESGYAQPPTQCPAPRSEAMEWVDVAVLAGALGLTAWLAIRKRSRRGVVAVAVFSMLYFGFLRKGCVCAVGAIQNVSVALFHGGPPLPWAVVLFFLLPLGFALFYGRVFCAAVCPLGAIQEVVVRRPVKLPRIAAGALDLVPYLYLGLAVLYAVTGAGYLICRFDPFIGFYRRGAPIEMLLWGAALLVLGVFVARPYCRFLCPYGVLLKWASRCAARHVTITPDKCVNCRLCEESCPFDSIQTPTPSRPAESRAAARARLARAVFMIPVLVAAGAGVGLAIHGTLAASHPAVQLAQRVALEEQRLVSDYTPESEAFRGTGQPLDALYGEARAVVARFRIGALVLGGFLGLVLGCRLLGLARWPQRKDYEIDRGSCLSCGRCFEYCPVERPVSTGERDAGHSTNPMGRAASPLAAAARKGLRALPRDDAHAS